MKTCCFSAYSVKLILNIRVKHLKLPKISFWKDSYSILTFRFYNLKLKLENQSEKFFNAIKHKPALAFFQVVITVLKMNVFFSDCFSSEKFEFVIILLTLPTSCAPPPQNTSAGKDDLLQTCYITPTPIYFVVKHATQS